MVRSFLVSVVCPDWCARFTMTFLEVDTCKETQKQTSKVVFPSSQHFYAFLMKNISPETNWNRCSLFQLGMHASPPYSSRTPPPSQAVPYARALEASPWLPCENGFGRETRRASLKWMIEMIWDCDFRAKSQPQVSQTNTTNNQRYMLNDSQKMDRKQPMNLFLSFLSLFLRPPPWRKNTKPPRSLKKMSPLPPWRVPPFPDTPPRCWSPVAQGSSATTPLSGLLPTTRLKGNHNSWRVKVN